MNRLRVIHKANHSRRLGADLGDIIELNRMPPIKRRGIFRQRRFQDPIELGGSDSLGGLSVDLVNYFENFGHPLTGKCRYAKNRRKA